MAISRQTRSNSNPGGEGPELRQSKRESGRNSLVHNRQATTLSKGKGRGSRKSANSRNTTSSSPEIEAKDGDEGQASSPDGDENDGDDEKDPAVIAPSGPPRRGRGRPPKSQSAMKIPTPIGQKRLPTGRAGLRLKSSLAPAAINTRKRGRPRARDGGEGSETSASERDQPPKRKRVRIAESPPTGILLFDNNDISSDPAQPILAEPLESDDDDDYAGVNLISDSDEDDDPEMERREERAIIDSHSHGLSAHSSGKADNTVASDAFFEDQFPSGEVRAGSYDDAADSDFLKRETQSDSVRKVRFDDEVPSSASSSFSSSDVDIALFPDLELHNSTDRPAAPRRTGGKTATKRVEGDQGSDGSGSYWDFQEDIPLSVGAEDSDLDTLPSSGYCSDHGETTEEDIPTRPTTSDPKALLHRRSSSDVTVSMRDVTRIAPPPPPQRQQRPLPHQRGPVLAKWTPDRTKTIAFMDPTGKRLLVFNPPRKRREIAASLSSSLSDASPTDPLGLLQEDAAAMELFGPNPSLPDLQSAGGLLAESISMFGEVTGPPEAFYAFKNFDAEGNVIPDEPAQKSGVDRGPLISLDDILAWESDSESDETPANVAESSGETAAETDAPVTPGPNTATTANKTSKSMADEAWSPRFTPTHHDETRNSQAHLAHVRELLHFYSHHVATAFRANQDRVEYFTRRGPLSSFHNDHAGGGVASASNFLRRGRSSDAIIAPVRKRGTPTKDATSRSSNRVSKTPPKKKARSSSPKYLAA